MDIKVDGLPYEILEKALEQAKQGRLHIMNIIKETLPESRPELKPHAPRMVTLTVDKDQIGAIIGPGGKIIQDIQEKSGAVIVIEEVGNQGSLSRLRLPVSKLSLVSRKSGKFMKVS